MNDPEDVGSEYYLRDLMNSFLRATDSIYKSLAALNILVSTSHLLAVTVGRQILD